MTQPFSIVRFIVLVFGVPLLALSADEATTKTKASSTSSQKANHSAEMLVFLEPGTPVQSVEARYGLVHRYTLKSDPNAHVFSAADAVQALNARQSIAQDPSVRQVYENRRTLKVRHAFVPNDPYFHKQTPSPWTGRGQWHLTNEYTDIDSRVVGAWKRNITGQGVTIGIVDDGLETAHPDLAPNYVAADSWDFGDNDADPNPVYDDDQHGISVAGVAAARGGNGIGVVGAAPYASLAGLRIDYANQTEAMFVDATLYHSSGGNHAITVKNHSYGVSMPYYAAEAESAALSSSVAAGTLHVFSAGNDRAAWGNGDPDSNRKQPQNSPDSITVAALGFDGVFAYYSCYGANVVATVPSSDELDIDCITTTDRTGSLGYNATWGDTFPDQDYTSLFGGTSSSAPLMSGILALAKQAQPLLTTRFAKHILARTCRLVDPLDATTTSDGGWRTNTVGVKFNQNYGFGLVDAGAFVNAVTQYTGVTALRIENTPTTTVNATIPDNNTTGITRTFNLSSNTPLEEMLITLNFTHTWETDLEVHLTAPNGYRSRLVKQYVETHSGQLSFQWTFCTHAFWGCNPQGTWTLNVSDRYYDDTGVWQSFSATARMGTLLRVAPQILNLARPDANRTVLQWSSLPDREYAVDWSTNLLNGFSTIASNLPARPPMNSYTDTTHHARRQFWRISVTP